MTAPVLDVGQLETLLTKTFNLGLDVGRGKESRDLVRLRLSKALLGVAEAQALAAESTMDMTALLDEPTYRVLGEAKNGADARQRLAIITHWAEEQDARLAAGKRTLRLDSAEMVAEALNPQHCDWGPEDHFGPCAGSTSGPATATAP